MWSFRVKFLFVWTIVKIDSTFSLGDDILRLSESLISIWHQYNSTMISLKWIVIARFVQRLGERLEQVRNFN